MEEIKKELEKKLEQLFEEYRNKGIAIEKILIDYFEGGSAQVTVDYEDVFTKNDN